MNLNSKVILVTYIAITIGCSDSANDQVARNIEVVRKQTTELWSKGNIDIINEIYAEDFIGHTPSGLVKGRKGIRNSVKAHRTSFPDWTEEIIETLAERDLVVIQFISTGTNKGEFLGRPPTGKKVRISEMAIYRMADGKILEQWVYPDILELQRQLQSSK
jgi:steroid delta-isomerase-like uncharacterized protein